MHRIAVIPGDGIGKEVVPEGIRVLEAVESALAFSLNGNFFRGVVNTICHTNK